MIYTWIGKAVVKYVAITFSKHLSPATLAKIGIGSVVGVTALTGVAIAAYVATRDVPEG